MSRYRGNQAISRCYNLISNTDTKTDDIIMLSGELIVSKYVAESITMIAGRFGHEGLCQLRTELKKLQCEIGYIANTGQWCLCDVEWVHK